VVEKVNDELGRIWNKADVPTSWNYPGLSVETDKKNENPQPEKPMSQTRFESGNLRI
jgi:hypothetical protein